MKQRVRLGTKSMAHSNKEKQWGIVGLLNDAYRKMVLNKGIRDVMIIKVHWMTVHD